MIKKQVKELMIPVAQYATVSQDATLLEAILILEQSQPKAQEHLQPYRAVLITDKHDNIIGKIGHLGFLKALEPKYYLHQDKDMISQMWVNPEAIQSMMDQLQLWQDNLEDICRRARDIRVRDVMRPITENIDEDASIIEAIHKIVMWQTLSLMVVKNNKVIGILRLSDLYTEVAQYIQESCSPEQ